MLQIHFRLRLDLFKINILVYFIVYTNVKMTVIWWLGPSAQLLQLPYHTAAIDSIRYFFVDYFSGIAMLE